jgi:hypothetical protein
MATIIKKAVTAQVVKVAPKVAVKATVKTAPKVGFEIVDMDSIQLVPKAGGGGRGLSEFGAKVYGLPHGKGFKISEEQYGDNGKGMASTYAGAARRGIKLRVRRDVNNQLWVFRVTEAEEIDAAERKAARDEAKAAA